MGRLWRLAFLAILSIPAAGSAQRSGTDTGAVPAQADEPIELLVVGRRSDEAPPVARVPPRCVRRPGDPADLVPVHPRTTDQRVIAPDRNGVLRWQGDRDPVLGLDRWQRAGNAIGQYVFRVPDDDSPLCIGAAIPKPGGWGQLRKVVKVTPDMVGKYMHFSTLIAARDAAKIRFWLVTGSMGARLNGGDTHRSDLNGTFGWKQADVIVGPIGIEATHISYGVLLWGKGDVWLTDTTLRFESRGEVRNMPSLPIG